MKVAILGGGSGTALMPAANSCPKALFPLGGKSLLAHQLDVLQELGVEDVAVVVESQFSRYVRATAVQDNPGMVSRPAS